MIEHHDAEWAFGCPVMLMRPGMFGVEVPTHHPAYDPAVFALRRVRHFLAADRHVGFSTNFYPSEWSHNARWGYAESARRAAEAVR